MKTNKRKPAKTKYYFAYGSNLNISQMKRRCPGAIDICRMTLEGYRLVFKGVADIVPDPKSVVRGAVYSITAADELALDRYEGYRKATPQLGLYRKEFFRGTVDRQSVIIMAYVMNSGGIYPPNPGYYDTIADGYTAFGIGKATLRAALAESMEGIYENGYQTR